jgi:hypothetical protein
MVIDLEQHEGGWEGEHRVPWCHAHRASQPRQVGGLRVHFPGAVEREAVVQHGPVDDHAPAEIGVYAVHSLRSAFCDWASERTNFARENWEAALSHIVKDKTEAAHRRGDLFEKRRDLMATWAAFLTANEATVIPLRRSGK